jgi:tryptophan synthase alpha chain
MGIILTDVPADEAGPFLDEPRDQGLAMIFLAAPTSSEDRIHLICEVTTGFVYCVTRLGITGERASLSGAFRPVLEMIRRLSDLPVGLGFGISTPEHAAAAGEIADAVIVGSALVRIVEDAPSVDAAAAQLESKVHDLHEALSGRSR